MPLTRAEYLFAKLSEECDEVGQRCMKTIIFGADEQQPGQPHSNARRVLDEFHDLVGVMEMLRDEGYITPVPYEEYREAIKAKQAKVNKFYAFSAARGLIAGISADPDRPHPEAPYGMCSGCHAPLPAHRVCLACVQASPAGPGE